MKCTEIAQECPQTFSLDKPLQLLFSYFLPHALFTHCSSSEVNTKQSTERCYINEITQKYWHVKVLRQKKKDE